MPKTKFIELHNQKIAYQDWGSENSQHQTVCVHGLTRNKHDFDHLARSLSDISRVICIDIAGRGESDWLPNPDKYNYQTYLSDIKAIFAKLKLSNVYWVGTSMGGIIGMLLCADSPYLIKKLILNDVGPFIPKSSLLRIKEYVGDPVQFKSIAESTTYFKRTLSGFGDLSDQQWDQLAQNSIKPLEDGKFALHYDPSIANAFQGELEDVDLWNIWDLIEAEVMTIRGENSDLLLEKTLTEMGTRGPKSKTAVIQNTGHAPALLSESEIKIIKEFLFSHASR
jgi:pimeloyl-ACP methyl ester carboxylesterase